MEEKETAEEFVLLFFRIQDESNETTWNQAKQCALISVNKIIETFIPKSNRNYLCEEIDFWNKFKTEIENLPNR